MFAFKCGAWPDPRIPLPLDFEYLQLWFQNTRLLSVQFASEKHVCTYLSLQNDLVGIHFTIVWVRLPVASFMQQAILLQLQVFCFVLLAILWRLTFKDPLRNGGVMSFPCTLQQYSHCYMCFFIQITWCFLSHVVTAAPSKDTSVPSDKFHSSRVCAQTPGSLLNCCTSDS